MSAVSRDAVEAAIRQYKDPYLESDLFDMKAVRSLDIEGNRIRVQIELPYPAEGLAGGMREVLGQSIETATGSGDIHIEISQRIHAHQPQGGLQSMAGVKNIIAVASGKGGVGKSTTAVNLALALAREGARTGILDADIYGPSVGMMLGFAEGTRPSTRDDKYFLPLEAHGVQAMSMAFLVNDSTPMVWRGPMVSGAVQQLLSQTLWDDLDFLIVDMPPGTGDIQLTLAQKVPVTGAVVVTTPQDIALLDCKKGIEMFRKVEIPVLGVVENMSVHICGNCGHQEPLFGEGGGARVAEQYHTNLLGQLPLHRTIREQTDSGRPSVVAEPDSEVARIYCDVARRLGAALSRRARNMSSPIPSMSVSDD